MSIVLSGLPFYSPNVLFTFIMEFKKVMPFQLFNSFLNIALNSLMVPCLLNTSEHDVFKI